MDSGSEKCNSEMSREVQSEDNEKSSCGKMDVATHETGKTRMDAANARRKRDD